MDCLLKRALPFIIGLAIGISFFFLFRTVSRFAPLPPSSSGKMYHPDIPQVSQSLLTQDEMEAIIEHKKGGLCHAHSRAIDVIKTETDNRVTSQAKILYMPEPSSWKKQPPCPTYCFVVMRVTLDASGKVTNIVPLSIDSHEEACEKDVLEAAQRIRFKPAMNEGKPVSEVITIIYNKWGHGTEIDGTWMSK